MSQIAVRPMLVEDSEGYFAVRSLTYNSGDPVPEERRQFRWTRPFVAEHQDEIKGVFNILDLTCTRGPALLRCGGVAGVAVAPHERRSGVGRAMMEWWIRQARDEGIQLSSLYGFSETYYRQFGYEVCGKRLKITCPGERLPRTHSALTTRRLSPEDWLELDPCYRSFAHARSGLSMRDEKLWMRILAENRPLTVYVTGDPVEAYAVVSHSVDFWATDHVSEIAWSSPAGYEALMEILRGVAINKKALSWYEPSDSAFLTRYLDTFVEVEIARPIMFRVNDVPKAIEALEPEHFGHFTMLVHDDLIPENRGPWTIGYLGDRISVQPCRDADLEIDVRQLAQALLGEPSFADLLRLGLVKVNQEAAVASALRLFPASPVYCPEFF